MKEIEVLKYEAFTSFPGKGNPSGVVLHGDNYTEEEMQIIAERAGYSETSFIRKSEPADLELRYFTPGHEMNLCGHATVASLYSLCEKGMLESGKTYSIQTKAGILPVKISEKEGRIHITLEQASPQFKPFTGDRKKLAAALGITEEDFHDDLPIVFGSTGIWTAIIPLASLEASKKMVPDNKQFPEVLVDLPKASVHPFTFETIHSDSDLHGRHFSSPYSGTIEDPVTGTASGVMGAYMQQYVRSGQRTFIIEQGQEIGKDGRVEIEVNGDSDHIKVNMTGTAVYSETRILKI
ncbi:PhzF family phenazine biosynthesis isomerase [Bacillus mojavensis]|uniref:PhzF family phenazine biosynthesis isomerase n=1 Tax=Bacillus mojavensis TaxID=72360 RepID=UPI002DBB2D07|nr:PhzF family phenazine biosynthesis isomerase [Bacillus mojavensis]MEC1634306.1 PhzF family phenazine biosynthesis isomerase [Bacillus mojavensis]